MLSSLVHHSSVSIAYSASGYIRHREEVEVTESDTGQQSEKAQHRSPSVKRDGWPMRVRGLGVTYRYTGRRPLAGIVRVDRAVSTNESLAEPPRDTTL